MYSFIIFVDGVVDVVLHQFTAPGLVDGRKVVNPITRRVEVMEMLKM